MFLYIRYLILGRIRQFSVLFLSNRMSFENGHECFYSIGTYQASKHFSTLSEQTPVYECSE